MTTRKPADAPKAAKAAKAATPTKPAKAATPAKPAKAATPTKPAKAATPATAAKAATPTKAAKAATPATAARPATAPKPAKAAPPPPAPPAVAPPDAAPPDVAPPGVAPPAPPARPAVAPPAGLGDASRFRHVSLVEALREPEYVHHLELSKPSAFAPVPADELAALPRLSEATRLESLRLGFTELETLAPLGGLRGLRRLNLVGNRFATLPAGIDALVGLEELDLSSNPRLDLAGALRVLAALPRLHRLVIGDRALGRVPEELAGLRGLTSLLIDAASAEALGDALTHLPRLHTLDLRLNANQGLPALLTRLAAAPALRHLRLSGARTTETLPDELGALTQIEQLTLSWMPLTELPTTMPAMTALGSVTITGRIKAPERKKLAARAPQATFYWDGQGPPAGAPAPPPLEVRRVPDHSGLGAFEALWGRRLPAELEASPATPQVLPPQADNAFEWLVARDQDGSPWYLHLLPFFLDAVPVDPALPNGDLIYAHLDAAPSPRVEYYLLVHDEGGPLPLAAIGGAAALAALWKRAETGAMPTPGKVTARGRLAALVERAGWIMDLLAHGATQAKVHVPDDAWLAAVAAAPGAVDDPADALYALWGAYLGGRDAAIPALVTATARSKSRVVRDAGVVVARLVGARRVDGRRLGNLTDAWALRRPA